MRFARGCEPDLFNVVNFGKDPAEGFKALRQVQPKGPLMCGEFYPGWFDTWGFPHHLGNTPQYLADLEYMLKNNASFSIYMAHGGTTFGMWSGRGPAVQAGHLQLRLRRPDQRGRLDRREVPAHAGPDGQIPAARRDDLRAAGG